MSGTEAWILLIMANVSDLMEIFQQSLYNKSSSDSELCKREPFHSQTKFDQGSRDVKIISACLEISAMALKFVECLDHRFLLLFVKTLEVKL